MFYYMYQITNKLNGKIYVGVHKTKDLNDGYMGSGKVIKRAIEKHGIENFEKVILETFEHAESMYAKEKEIVNDEFLAREDVYNLRRGGHGGFEFINNNDLNGTTVASIKRKELFETEWRAFWSKRHKEGILNAEPYDRNGSFKFNKHIQQLGNSPEARAKARISQRKTYAENGHGKGDKNSQYGTMWITDGINNRKIKKNDIIPDGWNKGRKMKDI